MSKRLLLAGYFGAGNLGDDAILHAFMLATSEHGFRSQALCTHPERISRTFGYTGIAKTDMSSVRDAIQECDALVFPGGSVFQDVTSVRSIAYYAKLVQEAKKANKKVIMLGQGIGPVNRWLGKRAAVAALNAADVLAVRDPASIQTLKSLGVTASPRLTADLAFLLPEPNIGEDSQNFGVGGMKTIGINARPWGKDKNKTVIDVFGDLAKLLNSNGYVPTMIVMDQEEDKPIVDAIAKAHGGKVPEIKVDHPSHMQQRIARMEAIISMRLHAGILAATVGVPGYMVNYDPKVAAFANVMAWPTPPNMQGITADRIFNGFQTFIKDREKLAATTTNRRAEQIDLAKQNIELLRQALGV